MAAGEQFFLNDFEITRLSTQTPEYQYHLKDHLGNVRVTFTSKDETETTTATYETANINTEQSQYVRYDNAKRINATLFDRTNGSSTGFSQRLNGTANEKYGLARSLSVMPGDVINAEVYAKYADTNTANWTGAMNTLMSQIAANTAGLVVDGTLYASSTSSFPAGFVGLQTPTDNGAPKAYLNWLIFDRNYGFITGGFKQITTAARETGTDVTHERVFNSAPIEIKQPGYVYIYLSNESPTQVEVFFDDFKVTHTKSPVLQQDDYYPFGLTFNSYQRENSVANQYLYNDKEMQDELGLDWLDYGWRMYNSSIGRWNGVDMLSEKYFDFSPYNYVANNPVLFIDPDGTWIPGKDGNAISWSVNDDGSIRWSENTSDEFKKIGESLWKSSEGKNSLYSMSSAESKINVSTSEDENTTIKSNGKITIDGVEYAEEVNISIGVKGGETYDEDVLKGTSVASQYVNETNIDENLSPTRIHQEFRELPFEHGVDPWHPYPAWERYEYNSTWIDGKTGKEDLTYKILGERPKSQAEWNQLKRKIHILWMNDFLQKRKSQR